MTHTPAYDPLVTFTRTIDRLATVVPEVAAKQEAIIRGAARLINRQPNITADPEKFTDPSTALLFGAVALREAMQQPEQAAEHRQFNDAVAHLITTPRAVANDFDPYQRYRHETASSRLKEKLFSPDGPLDGFKAERGIRPEHERPFEVHVLAISSGTNAQLDTDVLKQNRAILEKQQGHRIARAWVVHGTDAQHMFLSLPDAQLLLTPQRFREGSPEHAMLVQAKTLVEHEAAHIYDNFTVGRVGRGIEEIRAESWVRHRTVSHAYTDARLFGNRDLQILGGADLDKYTRTHGRDPVELYIALTHTIGLHNMLEFALTLPDALTGRLATMNHAERIVRDHLGDYDALSERIYRRAHPTRRADIDGRLAELARHEGPYSKPPLPFGSEFTPSFLNRRVIDLQRSGIGTSAYVPLVTTDSAPRPGTENSIITATSETQQYILEARASIQETTNLIAEALGMLETVLRGTTNTDALNTLNRLYTALTRLSTLEAWLTTGHSNLKLYLQELT